MAACAATVPRDQLWAAQTPQMFRYALLRRALEEAAEVTDEASAIEALGLHPKLVEGSPRNFKITLPHDVALAELSFERIDMNTSPNPCSCRHSVSAKATTAMRWSLDAS